MIFHEREPGWDTYVEKAGYRIPGDVAFVDIKPGDYDALILSGARAPEYLRNDPQLQKIVRHFVARKKPIAALCHGSLVLAAVGLYGVVAYLVAQRTHEMGIRMALGANRSDVFSLVVRQGLGLTLGGTLIGIPCALGAAQLLVHLVPSVRPGDPATLTAVSALLLSIAFAASYIPARRATRVDPIVALRYE